MQSLKTFGTELRLRISNMLPTIGAILAFPIVLAFKLGRAYERMEVYNSGKWVRA